MFNFQRNHKVPVASIALFVMLTFCIALKCILFHYFIFSQVLVSSLWKHPIDAIVFYTPKFLIAALFASFVFVTHKHYWTIIISVLIDIWMFAQLIYFNANGLLMDIAIMKMAGNMEGFWSSILALIQPGYFTLLLISVLYCVFYYFLSINRSTEEKKHWSLFCCIWLMCFGVNACEEYPCWKRCYLDDLNKIKETRKFGKRIEPCFGIGHFMPYWEIRNVEAANPNDEWKLKYAKRTSILHYVGAMIVYDIEVSHMYSGDDDVVVDIDKVNTFLNSSKTELAKSSIVIILVESFESWVFENPTLSAEYAPNLHNFLTQEHVFFCPNVKPEVKYGTSGDGQLITVTGLLPVNSGATTMKYGSHIYPSLFKMYEHSALIDLTPNGSWNQKQMSIQYMIKQEVRSDHKMTDAEVFQSLEAVLDTIESPYCVLALTGATHLPFDVAGNVYETTDNRLLTDLPSNIADYLRCLRITDKEMKVFLDKVLSEDKYKNTTIVITGDHNVFKSNTWKDIDRNECSYVLPVDQSFCPLIIYSKQLKNSICRTDTCYQKDIYPTIISLSGGCNFWKGVGVNLLNAERTLTTPELECFSVSDAIIRSNYFLQYADSL